MENRIAQLKLDEYVNEEARKDNAAELESECVSFFFNLNLNIIYSTFSTL